ncbi:uncharacterized protein LOC108602027 [Drosophila busckii]|uniref:uncharacterized protein LOC108602027 n=1 Tax=Drosophila busckii TaxID=30019 RepID=UPI00083ED862|nr:uncharacterized protein LOC108602027 [Drosophila busckii]
MEEFINLVAQYQCNAVDVSSSEVDSDSDVNFEPPKVKQRNTLTRSCAKDADSDGGKRKSAVMRLPTRRPDPNVYNRNALLARENRRKKKAHLEALERELNETRTTNKSLLKALKKQFKLTQKLEKECEYLKDVACQRKVFGQTNMILPRNDRAVSPNGSLISTYSSSSSYEVPKEAENIGLLSIKNDCSRTTAYDNDCSWNDYLDEGPFGLNECNSSLQPLGAIEEHSYFNKSTEMGFSPNCDWSASRTPPSQLLQDEDFLDDLSSL